MRSRSWFDALIDGLAVLAAALLCVLVVLICADVLARSTRLFSMPWTLDLAEAGLYLMTFLGAPWVLREQGHIAIEVFVDYLPKAARRVADQLVNLAGIVVCAILVVFSFRQLARSFSSGNQIYETFIYPEWYQYSVPPVVFLILGLLFARRLLGWQTMRKAGLDEGF